MPTDEQIKEIEDIITKAREVKDPASKEARDLYTKAIKLADEYFKIERPKEEIGEPEYDPVRNPPDGKNSGETSPTEKDGEGKAKTTLGPGAFVSDGKPSARWLAAVKVHEYAHAGVGVELRDPTDAEIKQMKEMGLKDDDIKKIKIPQFKTNDVNEEEVIAYDAMLKKAKDLGLSDSEIEWIKNQKKSFYNKMSDEKKKKYKAQEPWLGVRFSQPDFKAVVGPFIVPKGTPVFFDKDQSWNLPRCMRVDELANLRFEGDYQKLFSLNPGFSVEVAALQTLLFGPHGTSPVASTPNRLLLGSPVFLADGSLTRLPGEIETPCPGGTVLVRHAYSECESDGLWHVVEDDYVSCPPQGGVTKYRVFDMATTRACKDGAAPRPVDVAYKDLHGDSTCQSPKYIGDIIISECVDGLWENATYPLYECLDGTRRVSLPAKDRRRSDIPCSSAQSPGKVEP